MVLATRPRQEDRKHHLPDSADVSIVRSDRSLRLRTTCESRVEAERTFLLFTFTYGLGAGHALRVGQSPGGVVWEAPVTAIGRDARVCMSCDRYVPIFDCCVDANNVCMACMLAGRGPSSPPVPYAIPRPRGVAAAPAALLVIPESDGTAPVRRRRRGGRRRRGLPAASGDGVGIPALASA